MLFLIIEFGCIEQSSSVGLFMCHSCFFLAQVLFLHVDLGYDNFSLYVVVMQFFLCCSCFLPQIILLSIDLDHENLSSCVVVFLHLRQLSRLFSMRFLCSDRNLFLFDIPLNSYWNSIFSSSEFNPHVLGTK